MTFSKPAIFLAGLGLFTLAYGYLALSYPGVHVTGGMTTTQNFTLAAAPVHVISGTVKDEVMGWPLRARITILGDPVGPPAPLNQVDTNPTTGFYSMTLPEGTSYTLRATALVSGRTPFDQFRDASRLLPPCTGPRPSQGLALGPWSRHGNGRAARHLLCTQSNGSDRPIGPGTQL